MKDDDPKTAERPRKKSQLIPVPKPAPEPRYSSRSKGYRAEIKEQAAEIALLRRGLAIDATQSIDAWFENDEATRDDLAALALVASWGMRDVALRTLGFLSGKEALAHRLARYPVPVFAGAHPPINLFSGALGIILEALMILSNHLAAALEHLRCDDRDRRRVGSLHKTANVEPMGTPSKSGVARRGRAAEIRA